MVHLSSGISYAECVQAFGSVANPRPPICDIYRHPTAEATIIFTVFNPFNKNLFLLAKALGETVKRLIPGWNLATGSQFEFVTFGVASDGKDVRVFLREFSGTNAPAQIAPILAALAVFIAVFVIFGVFLGVVSVIETLEATKQARIALEAKQTDADIITQINDCVADGRCTQEEGQEALNTIFPEGITKVTTDPDKTTTASDDLLAKVGGAVNIIIPLVILGAIVAATKGLRSN